MKRSDCFRFRASELAERIPGPQEERFHIALTRGELVVELYEPLDVDRQSPHDRDECYVVLEGEGRFVMGKETIDVRVGDFLFVPAGVEHRFVDFGKSIKLWVIFYGPEGGDRL